MTQYLSKSLIFLILLIPITLITGPAIPDITISLSCLFFIFLLITKKKYKDALKDNIFYISLFFWLYLLLISFTAQNQKLSFEDSIIFIRFLIIPLFMVHWVFNDSKNLEKILAIVFFSIIFVSIDTLYQFTQYDSQFGFGKDIFGFKTNWYGRLTGPFGDELIPGAYLSRFSFLGLAYIFYVYRHNNKQNIIIILYLCIIGITIFASGERMALATFGMGILFSIIFLKQKRLLFFISFILMLLLIFFIKSIHPSYNDFKIIESTPFHLGLKVEKEYKCNDDSNTKCSKIIKLQPDFFKVIKNFKYSPYGEIYNLSLEMYKDHKLFGIGLNNFTFLCENDERYKRIIKEYVCVSHPHNFYIQWLVETGIIGLFIFILYIIVLCYTLIKQKINEYTIISITTILILFWPVMSTGSLLKNWNGVGTFFILGICLSLPKLKKYS